ncbi:hypothetical protein GUJ93_ZPchr0005g15697 [Zizania palustris]|uniref:F-box domain-containing protein n=1 Tax=Zizania palustris TaxID=103762 RepID=A0A8J5VF71_ZIZPA|nr:hypothetical protein GUJ93_ZPchr0005g15697 [Zizania palustris]
MGGFPVSPASRSRGSNPKFPNRTLSSSPRLHLSMDTARHNLSANVLRRIHKSLSCLVDRRRMDQICRSWRAAVAPQQHPPKRPLPWILVPSADGPSFSCALSGCATHDLRIPRDGLAARYFGAYDGGWLFLAFGKTYDHAIVNLRTNRNTHKLEQEKTVHHFGSF